MKKIKKIILFLFMINIIFIFNYVYADDNNANLKSLTVNKEGLTPDFYPDKTIYSLFVPNNVNSIKINAIPEDQNATVNITGNTNFKTGDNIVNIDVTSNNKINTKQYKIIVTKTGDFEASNSYLLNLIVENATINPKFEPQIFNYDLGSVQNSITKLRLLVFPQDDNIPYTVSGNDQLEVGDNEITITVTSLDNLTKKIYTLRVHRNSIERDEEVGIPEPEIEYIDTNKLKKDNHNIKIFKNVYFYILASFCILLVIIIIFKIIKNKKKNK